MKTRGYSSKIRLLSFFTVLLLIGGCFIYGMLAFQKDPSLFSFYNSIVSGASDSAPLAASMSERKEDAESSGEPAETVQAVEKTIKVLRGDTLFSLLDREGVNPADAEQSVHAINAVFDPRSLKPGQQIVLTYAGSDQSVFTGMRVTLDLEEDLVVNRGNNDEYSAGIVRRELTRHIERFEGHIESTLYGSAISKGLPLLVLMDMIYAYSFDIDFQRDIRPGDSYSLIYEQYLDKDGALVRNGDILYAELTVLGKIHRLYRYVGLDGTGDFYDENGKSVRKTLIRTPINGAHITSGFGPRIQPIYGYNSFHKGIDFGAAIGTPIYAAGDGILTYIGYDKTFGNHIVVSHPNEYSTMYAHMSAYRKGIYKGMRVKQGQTIGYVGMTGQVTGPHLHYEVHFRGAPVNPAYLKFPPGKTLTGLDLTHFGLVKRELDEQFAQLGPKFAYTGDKLTAPGTE